MKSKSKRSMRRMNDNSETISCCHGVVHTITDKVLGAEVYSPAVILDRLRKIDGLKVVKVRDGVGNVMFPTLRLPEVTRVLVPLDSVRAPGTLAAAARGRIR